MPDGFQTKADRAQCCFVYNGLIVGGVAHLVMNFRREALAQAGFDSASLAVARFTSELITTPGTEDDDLIGNP